MIDQSIESVFLGCPTHNGLLDYKMAKSFFAEASKERNIFSVVRQDSLLARSFNELWCNAMNMRQQYGLKWFAMLHADIAPERWWLDKLISIAEDKGADLLSAIVPIKNFQGVTSTAISNPANPYGAWMRLTQKQIHRESFPETFDIEELIQKGIDENHVLQLRELEDDGGNAILLVNTGCMICRLDQPWSEEVFFTINDRVGKQFNKMVVQVEPEDWFFSRLVSEHGGKVMATKGVSLKHVGTQEFDNQAVWGSEVDPNCPVV